MCCVHTVERQQLTTRRSEEVSHVAVEVKCISSTEDKKGLEEKMFGAFKATARTQLGWKEEREQSTWDDPVGHCRKFGFCLPMRTLSRGLASPR